MTNYMDTQILTDVGRVESVRQLGKVKTLMVIPKNSKK